MKKREQFFLGMRGAIGIAIGYFPIAMSFAILAVNLAVPVSDTILMSVLVYSTSGQFIGMQMLAQVAALSSVILTVGIINIKGVLTSMTVSRKLEKGLSNRLLAAISFGLTDETFAKVVASPVGADGRVPGYYALGLTTAAYLSWVLGTVVGVLVAQYVPASLLSAMGIAVFALFLGISVRGVRGSLVALLVFVGAALLNVFWYYIPMVSQLPSSISFLLISVGVSALGAAIATAFPNHSLRREVDGSTVKKRERRRK